MQALDRFRAGLLALSLECSDSAQRELKRTLLKLFDIDSLICEAEVRGAEWALRAQSEPDIATWLGMHDTITATHIVGLMRAKTSEEDLTRMVKDQQAEPDELDEDRGSLSDPPDEPNEPGSVDVADSP